MGAASRRKGATAEARVAAWFRAHGFPNARRFLSGDGAQPGDIDGVQAAVMVEFPIGLRFGSQFDACVEVKDCLTYSPGPWMAQAEAEARPGQVPIVVFHPKGEADVGRWFVLTRLHHLYPDQEPQP